jgi:hypothetical protein
MLYDYFSTKQLGKVNFKHIEGFKKSHIELFNVEKIEPNIKKLEEERLIMKEIQAIIERIQ